MQTRILLHTLQRISFIAAINLLATPVQAQNSNHTKCTLEEFLANCENLHSAQKKDSLINLINQSTVLFPDDLMDYVLILEDYSISDWLTNREVKLWSLVTQDMADSMFSAGILRKSSLKRYRGYIHNATCRFYSVEQFIDSTMIAEDRISFLVSKVIPQNLSHQNQKKTTYQDLPEDTYRYVLQTIFILNYKKDKLQLLKGEIPVPFMVSAHLYLYDRKEKRYFQMRELKKYLKALKKFAKESE